MSQTRNQRRRDRILEKIFRGMLFLLLIWCLLALAKQCRDIEELQEKIGSSNITIVAADTFLPEGFSAQSAAYQAALQRYNAEHGYIIPEQKETAPEAATSEAGRCKKK